MATTKRLIEQALRTIGVLASGEEARPAEMQDGLLALQQMLDGWSTQEVLVPAVSRETFPFVEGQREYTIGEGGDFDTQRPRSISVLTILQGGGTQVPCDQAPLAMWEHLRTKHTSVGTPCYFYYQEHAQGDLGLLTFSSIPFAIDSAVIASIKPLVPNMTLTEGMELPAEYEPAIRWNLAIDLAPEYGKDVSAVIVKRAKDTLNDIKRMNHRPRHAKVDRGITAPNRRYNINSGPE